LDPLVPPPEELELLVEDVPEQPLAVKNRQGTNQKCARIRLSLVEFSNARSPEQGTNQSHRPNVVEEVGLVAETLWVAQAHPASFDRWVESIARSSVDGSKASDEAQVKGSDHLTKLRDGVDPIENVPEMPWTHRPNFVGCPRPVG
jgi:hypothetical protein